MWRLLTLLAAVFTVSNCWTATIADDNTLPPFSMKPGDKLDFYHAPSTRIYSQSIRAGTDLSVAAVQDCVGSCSLSWSPSLAGPSQFYVKMDYNGVRGAGLGMVYTVLTHTDGTEERSKYLVSPTKWFAAQEFDMVIFTGANPSSSYILCNQVGGGGKFKGLVLGCEYFDSNSDGPADQNQVQFGSCSTFSAFTFAPNSCYSLNFEKSAKGMLPTYSQDTGFPHWCGKEGWPMSTTSLWCQLYIYYFQGTLGYGGDSGNIGINVDWNQALNVEGLPGIGTDPSLIRLAPVSFVSAALSTLYLSANTLNFQDTTATASQRYLMYLKCTTINTRSMIVSATYFGAVDYLNLPPQAGLFGCTPDTFSKDSYSAFLFRSFGSAFTASIEVLSIAGTDPSIPFAMNNKLIQYTSKSTQDLTAASATLWNMAVPSSAKQAMSIAASITDGSNAGIPNTVVAVRINKNVRECDVGYLPNGLGGCELPTIIYGVFDANNMTLGNIPTLNAKLQGATLTAGQTATLTLTLLSGGAPLTFTFSPDSSTATVANVAAGSYLGNIAMTPTPSSMPGMSVALYDNYNFIGTIANYPPNFNGLRMVVTVSELLNLRFEMSGGTDHTTSRIVINSNNSFRLTTSGLQPSNINNGELVRCLQFQALPETYLFTMQTINTANAFLRTGTSQLKFVGSLPEFYSSPFQSTFTLTINSSLGAFKWFMPAQTVVAVMVTEAAASSNQYTVQLVNANTSQVIATKSAVAGTITLPPLAQQAHVVVKVVTVGSPAVVTLALSLNGAAVESGTFVATNNPAVVFVPMILKASASALPTNIKAKSGSILDVWQNGNQITSAGAGYQVSAAQMFFVGLGIGTVKLSTIYFPNIACSATGAPFNLTTQMCDNLTIPSLLPHKPEPTQSTFTVPVSVNGTASVFWPDAHATVSSLLSLQYESGGVVTPLVFAAGANVAQIPESATPIMMTFSAVCTSSAIAAVNFTVITDLSIGSYVVACQQPTASNKYSILFDLPSITMLRVFDETSVQLSDGNGNNLPIAFSEEPPFKSFVIPGPLPSNFAGVKMGILTFTPKTGQTVPAINMSIASISTRCPSGIAFTSTGACPSAQIDTTRPVLTSEQMNTLLGTAVTADQLPIDAGMSTDSLTGSVTFTLHKVEDPSYSATTTISSTKLFSSFGKLTSPGTYYATTSTQATNIWMIVGQKAIGLKEAEPPLSNFPGSVMAWPITVNAVGVLTVQSIFTTNNFTVPIYSSSNQKQQPFFSLRMSDRNIDVYNVQAGGYIVAPICTTTAGRCPVDQLVQINENKAGTTTVCPTGFAFFNDRCANATMQFTGYTKLYQFPDAYAPQQHAVKLNATNQLTLAATISSDKTVMVSLYGSRSRTDLVDTCLITAGANNCTLAAVTATKTYYVQTTSNDTKPTFFVANLYVDSLPLAKYWAAGLSGTSPQLFMPAVTTQKATFFLKIHGLQNLISISIYNDNGDTVPIYQVRELPTQKTYTKVFVAGLLNESRVFIVAKPVPAVCAPKCFYKFEYNSDTTLCPPLSTLNTVDGTCELSTLPDEWPVAQTISFAPETITGVQKLTVPSDSFIGFTLAADPALTFTRTITIPSSSATAVPLSLSAPVYVFLRAGSYSLQTFTSATYSEALALNITFNSTAYLNYFTLFKPTAATGTVGSLILAPNATINEEVRVGVASSVATGTISSNGQLATLSAYSVTNTTTTEVENSYKIANSSVYVLSVNLSSSCSAAPCATVQLSAYSPLCPASYNAIAQSSPQPPLMCSMPVTAAAVNVTLTAFEPLNAARFMQRRSINLVAGESVGITVPGAASESYNLTLYNAVTGTYVSSTIVAGGAFGSVAPVTAAGIYKFAVSNTTPVAKAIRLVQVFISTMPYESVVFAFSANSATSFVQIITVASSATTTYALDSPTAATLKVYNEDGVVVTPTIASAATTNVAATYTLTPGAYAVQVTPTCTTPPCSAQLEIVGSQSPKCITGTTLQSDERCATTNFDNVHAASVKPYSGTDFGILRTNVSLLKTQVLSVALTNPAAADSLIVDMVSAGAVVDTIKLTNAAPLVTFQPTTADGVYFLRFSAATPITRTVQLYINDVANTTRQTVFAANGTFANTINIPLSAATAGVYGFQDNQNDVALTVFSDSGVAQTPVFTTAEVGGLSLSNGAYGLQIQRTNPACGSSCIAKVSLYDNLALCSPTFTYQSNTECVGGVPPDHVPTAATLTIKTDNILQWAPFYFYLNDIVAVKLVNSTSAEPITFGLFDENNTLVSTLNFSAASETQQFFPKIATTGNYKLGASSPTPAIIGFNVRANEVSLKSMNMTVGPIETAASSVYIALDLNASMYRFDVNTSAVQAHLLHKNGTQVYGQQVSVVNGVTSLGSLIDASTYIVHLRWLNPSCFSSSACVYTVKLSQVPVGCAINGTTLNFQKCMAIDPSLPLPSNTFTLSNSSYSQLFPQFLVQDDVLSLELSALAFQAPLTVDLLDENITKIDSVTFTADKSVMSFSPVTVGQKYYLRTTVNSSKPTTAFLGVSVSSVFIKNVTVIFTPLANNTNTIFVPFTSAGTAAVGYTDYGLNSSTAAAKTTAYDSSSYVIYGSTTVNASSTQVTGSNLLGGLYVLGVYPSANCSLVAASTGSAASTNSTTVANSSDPCALTLGASPSVSWCPEGFTLDPLTFFCEWLPLSDPSTTNSTIVEPVTCSHFRGINISNLTTGDVVQFTLVSFNSTMPAEATLRLSLHNADLTENHTLPIPTNNTYIFNPVNTSETYFLTGVVDNFKYPVRTYANIKASHFTKQGAIFFFNPSRRPFAHSITVFYAGTGNSTGKTKAWLNYSVLAAAQASGGESSVMASATLISNDGLSTISASATATENGSLTAPMSDASYATLLLSQGPACKTCFVNLTGSNLQVCPTGYYYHSDSGLCLVQEPSGLSSAVIAGITISFIAFAALTVLLVLVMVKQRMDDAKEDELNPTGSKVSESGMVLYRDKDPVASQMEVDAVQM